jgi:hypothetical protein
VFFAVAGVLAWWLSLGPKPQAFGRDINAPALYTILYDYVPGYDGLRVPARFAALVVLALGVLAGFGVRDLLRAVARRGAVVPILAALVLSESTVVPMPLNVSSADRVLPPPARVYPATSPPPVYLYVANLPPGMVLAELPFGDNSWDLRAVFYSAVHWRPLLNGYSGGFPEGFLRLRSYLDDPLRAPNDAFEALMASGATHLILHTSAYEKPESMELQRWLETRGVRTVAQFGPDLVYQLR